MKLFEKYIIKENTRGFLFKDGKFIKMLEPGKYTFFGKNHEVEVRNLNMEVYSANCDREVLLKDKNIADQCDIFEIKEGTVGLYFSDGVYKKFLTAGKYAFWKIYSENKVLPVDLSNPEVSEDIPRYLFAKIPNAYYQTIEVGENEECLLFYDGKFIKKLSAGTHYFWITNTSIEVTHKIYDMRLKNIAINSQEVLSADKVTLRVNLTVNYKITDTVKLWTEIDNIEMQLYLIAQLALRDYIGRKKLDDILESKDEISEYILKRFKEKEKSLYVNIVDTGVKDIILPGEIRDIMNTVLIAEKKAQASVITRREEVASTRSLLNTAKLMEENKTLYKLKELEYIERICENVGNINLNGSGNILNQLVSLMGKSENGDE